MANAEDFSDAFDDTSEAESEEERSSVFGEADDAASGGSSEDEDANGEDDAAEDLLLLAFAQRRSAPSTQEESQNGRARRVSNHVNGRHCQSSVNGSRPSAPALSSRLHAPQRVSPYAFTSNVSDQTNAALVKIADGVVAYQQTQQGRSLTRSEKEGVMKQVQQMLHHGVQRSLTEPLVLVGYADNVVPPNNEREYVAWAKRYMDDTSLNDANLPPIMSYIWQPYPRPPSVWSRGWLPTTIDEYNLPHWKIMLMYLLGAGPDEIAARAMTLSSQAPNYKAERSRMKGRFRRRIDDWRKTRGGLVFANAKQETSKIIESILTGTYRNFEGKTKNREYRQPLTPLQLQFNCFWDIDTQAGIMVQPNAADGVAPPVNHRVPYGGRNYSRLFKLAPMPTWVSDQLDAFNIARPDIAALKQHYPVLLQDHLCIIDPNVNGSYAVGPASASSSPVKRDSPKKTASSSPSKNKSCAPGARFLANPELDSMMPPRTIPTRQPPGMPINPYGHANQPWMQPDPNNFFSAADAYKARMLPSNPWAQTQQLQSSAISSDFMQSHQFQAFTPSFGSNGHNAMMSAPPPWAYPPQHHNSTVVSDRSTFLPPASHSQQGNGIFNSAGAMTGGRVNIGRSFETQTKEGGPNIPVDPALLADFDFDAQAKQTSEGYA